MSYSVLTIILVFLLSKEAKVDEKITELAKSLGISTEDKVREQILKEIMEKNKEVTLNIIYLNYS